MTELERLRLFAEATASRHTAIRDRLAQVYLGDDTDAWDLGAYILAVLDSPPAPGPWVPCTPELLAEHPDVCRRGLRRPGRDGISHYHRLDSTGQPA
ncbi:hypothetical protein [Streptomyces sp. ISL-94]|uniref:hypothetical protein n=1 Tax=Streptomyces sp. ISL-94 TaxID=2819190 RepID=UPI001BE5E3DB|nr:hypothetical protein [Streptomyces sp. ISL-94]MBT2477607.1 hypothetical protein [Streptomyces sp. ISL-94]